MAQQAEDLGLNFKFLIGDGVYSEELLDCKNRFIVISGKVKQFNGEKNLNTYEKTKLKIFEI